VSRVLWFYAIQRRTAFGLGVALKGEERVSRVLEAITANTVNTLPVVCHADYHSHMNRHISPNIIVALAMSFIASVIISFFGSRLCVTITQVKRGFCSRIFVALCQRKLLVSLRNVVA